MPRRIGNELLDPVRLRIADDLLRMARIRRDQSWLFCQDRRRRLRSYEKTTPGDQAGRRQCDKFVEMPVHSLVLSG